MQTSQDYYRLSSCKYEFLAIMSKNGKKQQTSQLSLKGLYKLELQDKEFLKSLYLKCLKKQNNKLKKMHDD